MPVKEILQDAKELVVVIETTLNNTLDNPIELGDIIAGPYAEYGNTSFDPQAQVSNANVKLATRTPKGMQADMILEDGVTLIRESGSKLGDKARASFGSARILNTRTSDEYSLRTWEDKNYTMKVGGVVYPKNEAVAVAAAQKLDTLSGVELDYSEYEILATGRFGAKSVDSDSVGLSILPLDSGLYKPFPINFNDHTEDAGDVLPYQFGVPIATTPANLGGGIYKIHDGVADTKSQILESPLDFVAFSEARKYHGRGLNTSAETTTDVAITEGTFNWEATADNTLEADSHKVAISEGFDLSTNGKLITVSLSDDNTHVRRYTRPNHTWYRVSDKEAESATAPKVNIVTTGDIDIVALHTDPDTAARHRSSWVKIAADGSGTVTLSFEEKLATLELVVRAVRDPIQTVSNWSTAPTSITPEFPVTDVKNHVVRFENFGKQEITFDYDATVSSALCAIWVNEAVIAEPQECKITITADPPLISPELSFYLNEGQLIKHNNSTPSTIDASVASATFSGNYTELTLPVTYSYGEFSVSITGGDLGTGATYGTFTNDKNGYLLKPSLTTDANLGWGGLPMLKYDTRYTGPNDVYGGQNSTIRFTAALVSGGGTDVIRGALFEGTPIPPLFRVTEEPKEFEFHLYSNDASHSTRGQGWYINFWQDNYVGKGWSATNPTIDYSVEITELSVIIKRSGGVLPDPSGTLTSDLITQDGDVFVIDEGERKQLSSVYCDGSAEEYRDLLPKGIAILDQQGYVAVCADYDGILCSAIGRGNRADNFDAIDAARELCLLAAGEDLIETDITDAPHIAYPITVQKPLIEHLTDMLGSLDYMVIPQLATNKVLVKKRFDYQRYPSDFLLVEGRDFVEGSIVSASSEPRERQYVIHYNVDHADNNKSLAVTSAFGSLYDGETKTYLSPLQDRAPTEELGERITRDSSPNSVFKGTLHGVGWDIELGDAGVVKADDVPPNRPCIIVGLSEDLGERQTTITFKVLERVI